MRRRLIPASSAVVLAGILASVVAGGSGAAVRPAASAAAAATASRTSPATAGRTSPAAAVSGFGVDLMGRIGRSGNMVFSPYSVATVVAMVGTGASGATATQIAHVLHVGSPGAIAGVGTLSSILTREQAAAAAGATDPPELDLANGLFLQQGFAVLPAFAGALSSRFGAGPQPVDFADDPAAATGTINQFVSAHTAGVIPSILGPGQLDRSTRLALVNAIYLKAGWANPFAVSATAKRVFHAPGGRRTVPFMSETSPLRYARGHGYVAVELPYANSTFALLVLRPTGQESAFEKTVSPALLARARRALRPAEVAVRMPRFHISLAADLSGALERLGMTDAFSPQAADFSGISSSPLVVSLVQHDADFTVDEQGTIATAATVGGISATAEEIPPKPAVTIDLNRPFPFYLIDTKTGAVIFAGRLADPSGAPAGG